MTKYAIAKWSGGDGILVEAESERLAREAAAAWIGEEPVAVRAVVEYAAPARSRPSVPPSVSQCTEKAREHTRNVASILGGVRLPQARGAR